MTEQTKHTLAPFVSELQVGDPTGHLNLTLVPLRGERHGQLDYILGSAAIAGGTLTVTEVSEGGTVPELLAANAGHQMVLLLDGEELIGAKQNRILNTSVLLPPKSRTKIPVSCVEQGRWHHVSREFKGGGYSPAKLRARKSRDVSHNLELAGMAMSDQSAVWEEVSDTLNFIDVTSPTMAMNDVVKHRGASLDSYVQALRYPADARGVIVAIDGRFVAMDLMDQPQTLQSVWDRLLMGYAIDAIASRQADRTIGFSSRGAGELLGHLAELTCRPRPTVGLGRDWRFEAPDLLGQALVMDGTCVHMSAFPNDMTDRGRDRQQAIQPPSQRRRARRGGPDDEIIY